MEIKALEDKIAFLERQNEVKEKQRKSQNDKINSLENKLEVVLRLLFGKKSERFVKEDPNQ